MCCPGCSGLCKVSSGGAKEGGKGNIATKPVAWIVTDYVKRHPEECLETVIANLCQDREKGYAKQLAEEFGVKEYAENCEE